MMVWKALRRSPIRRQVLARAVRNPPVVSPLAVCLVRQYSTSEAVDNPGEHADKPEAADSPRGDLSTSETEPQGENSSNRWLVKASEQGLWLSGDVFARQDGTVNRPMRRCLPHFWLRDNCRCSECVNQDTMQRNFDTFDIPESIKATEAKPDASGVSVQWSDGHTSYYDWDFLKRYTESGGNPRPDRIERFWGAEASEKLRAIGYTDVMNTQLGVARLTWGLKRYGYMFVTNTPYGDPDKTRQLLERIAFIRQTHYGGFYDFIPDLAMADTAYTNLALPAHTDTTYFTEPAGLQAFHMLSHKPAPGASPEEAAEAASGGKSLLVDGFHAAGLLKWEDPKAWKALTQVGIRWHASGNKGINIAPDKLYPVLELDDEAKVHRIRWNNSDRGVVSWTNKQPPTTWYKAARKFDEILKRKEMQYWVQLKPGNVLIFDNWRVLHGRSAFTGIRRICGGYINRDDYISRFRNSNYPYPEVLKRVIG